MLVRVRQNYYRAVQLGQCDFDQFGQEEDHSRFIPYKNENSNKFLESQVIRDLYDCGDFLMSDYYGVVSWKFKSKIHKRATDIFYKMEKDRYSSEVYAFNPNKGNVKINVIKQGDNWHPLFSRIYRRIAELMDFPDSIFTVSHELIYSNHWIASKDVFKRYCKTYLIPVMELMHTDMELNQLCFSNSNYISRSKLSAEACEKVFHRPYYTYHAFILERLFPIFCQIEDIKVKHI